MRAFIFDTETTDLIKNRHRPLSQLPHITELFGLVLEAKTTRLTKTYNWQEKGNFNSLFNPGIPLSPEIQKITGLTDAVLADQPSFKSKANEIKKLIESSDMIVAHNLSFDRAMVEIEMERCGLGIKWPKRMICTVESTEHFRSRRLKLMELHEYLFNGERFEGAHRAENDVRPLTRCFIELMNRGVI